MRATISTYPWDIADEGIDPALDNIQNVAGLNDVSLAVSYHIATYFLPHNPQRQLYYGEDGMVLFEPDYDRYVATRIVPRVSELVDGPDYLRRITDRIHERGLGLTAWIVYCYNHFLAREYPDCAKQDALGNRYLSQLSLSHPDVRSYFLALTEDIMERCRPTSVILESLSFREMEYGLMNPKVNAKITPWHRFLLGLCMSDESVDAAEEHGVAGRALRREVAAHLRTGLRKIPTEDEMTAPVTPERIATAFDGQLQAFIDSRVDVASSLFEEVAQVVQRCGDVNICTGFLGDAPNPVTGLSPKRLTPLLDYQYVFPVVESLRQQAKVNDVPLCLNIDPTAYSDSKCMYRAIAECLDAGAKGVSFYAYGLVQEEHLRWVGEASRLWR